MYKKLSVILLSLVLLTGCSANIFDRNSSSVLQESTGTILWWGLFETSENIQPLIDKFKEDNPGVEVEYVQKDQVTYMEDLNAVLQDGNVNTTPDIFMLHNSWVGNYASFSSNAPAGIISIDDFKSDFHNFVSEDFGNGDQVRGIPMWVDMLGVVYHKNMFIDNGYTVVAKDWNDLKTQAETLAQTDDSSGLVKGGFSAGNSENVEFSFEVMNLLMLQARDTELNEEILAVPFSEAEQQQVSEAFQFYKSFDSNSWNSTFKLDTAAFIEGDLASIILPSWRIYDVIAFNSEKNLGYDIGVSELPQLNPDSENKVNLATYWGNTISTDSSKKDISWELLKYVSSQEGQELYMDTVVANGRPFAMISPRKDMLSKSEEDRYLANYVNSIPYTHSWYMLNGIKLEQSFSDALNSGDASDILTTFNNVKENENVL